jgi:hypothetical protein
MQTATPQDQSLAAPAAFHAAVSGATHFVINLVKSLRIYIDVAPVYA